MIHLGRRVLVKTSASAGCSLTRRSWPDALKEASPEYDPQPLVSVLSLPFSTPDRAEAEELAERQRTWLILWLATEHLMNWRMRHNGQRS